MSLYNLYRCALLSAGAFLGAHGTLLAHGNDSIYTYEDAGGTVHFSDDRPDVTYPVREVSFQESFRRAIQKISKSELRRLITTLSEQYNVEAPLIEAVVRAESEYDPMAVSKKGARGLMQLMPATAQSLGVNDVHDPEDNLRGGVRHLQRLLIQFNGNVNLVAAAYNAGENAVTRHNGVPPYPETVDYVKRVRKYYDEFREQSSRSASRNTFRPEFPL